MRLVLFSTLGTGLADWQRTGTLARELELYRRVAPSVAEVVLVTYGEATEERRLLAQAAPELGLLAVPRGAAAARSLVLGRRLPAGCAILKTNQMRGAWAAVRARRPGDRVYVRTGYTWSWTARRMRSPWHRALRGIERWTLARADLASVTSDAQRRYLRHTGVCRSARLVVAPNHVDLDTFAPRPRRAERDIVVVGRLSSEKRPALVLAAAARGGYRATFAGAGPLAAPLEQHARRIGVDAHFLGAVPNGELPELFARHHLFVQASAFENMPKSLVEAMASGIPVVACRAPGVSELVEPGCGALADGTAVGLANQIAAALADPAAAAARAARARAMVVERFSLDAAVARELALYARLSGGEACPS